MCHSVRRSRSFTVKQTFQDHKVNTRKRSSKYTGLLSDCIDGCAPVSRIRYILLMYWRASFKNTEISAKVFLFENYPNYATWSTISDQWSLCVSAFNVIIQYINRFSCITRCSKFLKFPINIIIKGKSRCLPTIRPQQCGQNIPKQIVIDTRQKC